MIERLDMAEHEEIERLQLTTERIEAQKELERIKSEFERGINKDNLQDWIATLNAKIKETEKGSALYRGLLEERNNAETKALDKVLQDYRRFDLDKLKSYRETIQEQLKLSEGNYEKQIALANELDNVNEAIFNKEEQRLRDIGDAIGNLGKLIGKFDEKLGSSISNVSKMVDEVAGLVSNISSGNVFGSIGSIIGVFDSLVDIFKKQNDSIEQITLKTESLLDKQDRLLRRASGQDQLNEMRNAIDARRGEIEKILTEIDNMWEEYYNADLPDIGKQSLKNLAIQMQNEGNELIRQFEDEIYDLQQQIKEIETATVIPEIANIISQQFQKGKSSIEDFANTFEYLMKQAIIDSFERQIISGALQTFYNEFSRLSAGGLTAEDINNLRALWDTTTGDITNKWNDFVKVAKESGIDLFDTIEQEAEQVSFDGLTETLSDAIFTGFEQGKYSIQDFGNNFKDLMRQVLIDSFKADVVKKQLEPLVEMFNNLQVDGFTGNELAQFEDAFQNTSEQIAQQWQAFVNNAKESGIDLIETISETANNEFSGIADSLQNAIINGLKEGHREFADFGSDVNEILKKAILDAFALQVLSAPLKKLAEKAGEFAENGFNQNELGELQFELNRIIENAVSGFDALKEISKDVGIELGNIQTDVQIDSKGLTGAIKGITEETAGLLAGQFNALRMNTVEMLGGVRALNFNVSDMLTVAENSLVTLDKIEINTRYLKRIYSKMTASTREEDLRAIGGL